MTKKLYTFHSVSSVWRVDSRMPSSNTRRGVHGCPACPQGRTQRITEVLKHGPVLGTADAPAARNDNLRFRQVHVPRHRLGHFHYPGPDGDFRYRALDDLRH